MVDSVIQKPAPRPRIQRGEPLRSVAGKFQQYGDENAVRIVEGRSNYEAVRQDYTRGARR